MWNNRRIVIAITGTPGTGKSSAARELSKIIGADVIDAGKFAKENGIVEGFDARRRSWIVDTKKLKDKILKRIKTTIEGPVIVEGHYSEEVCDPDVIFVLRCRPDVLGKRLGRRGYSREKIEENLLAEALDYCTISACSMKKAIKVYELDSTGAGKKSLAEIMAHVLSSKKYVKKYSPKTDYSSGFLLLRSSSRKR